MRRHIKTIVATHGWFLLLILIYCALRLYQFESHVMFLGDQGRDALIMKDIVTLKHFPAIGAPTSIGQIYLGPFYYYLVAPFLLLFNFSPVGPAFGVFFYGLLFTTALYFILLRLTKNKVVPLATVFFITFSAPLINVAQFSWNPNLLPFFSVFSLLFLHLMLTTGKNRYAILFGTFFSLAFQLHFLAALMIPTFIVYLLLTLQVKEIVRIARIVKLLVVSVFSFFVFFIPLLIFDLRHNFINSNNLIKLFNEPSFMSNQSYISKLGETIKGFYENVLNIQTPFLAVLAAIAIILFCIYLYSKYRDKLFTLFILNSIFYLLTFALITSPRYEHYFGVVTISFYTVVAFIVSELLKSKKLLLLGYGILFLFLVVSYPKYQPLLLSSNNQIGHSVLVAKKVNKLIDKIPYNIATWPVEFGEDNYVYFLSLYGNPPLDRKKIEIGKKLIVLCAKNPCEIIGSPSWNINMFGPAKIDKIERVENITIYLLSHTKRK